MSPEQLQYLLRKYRTGKCTPEEKEIIDQWYSATSAGKEEFRDLEEEGALKERLWKAIDTHIENTAQKTGLHKKALSVLKWSYIGIAASVVFALAFFVYEYTKSEGRPPITAIVRQSASDAKWIANEDTEPLEVCLPDGSRAVVFPKSRIAFSEAFSRVQREVFLEGEAYFNVSHNKDRPFLVYTDALVTKVLGTSFLIKAYKDQEETVVTVKSGKVSVYAHGGREVSQEEQEEIVLRPNQQVVYDFSKKVAVKKFVQKPEPVNPEPAKRNTYTNDHVIDILRSLEAQYGIDIAYDSVALLNCTLTADMSREGFYEQLEILCAALGAEYQLSEDAVIISGTGCNVN